MLTGSIAFSVRGGRFFPQWAFGQDVGAPPPPPNPIPAFIFSVVHKKDSAFPLHRLPSNFATKK